MSDIKVNEVVDKVVATAKDWAGIAAQRAAQGFDLGKTEYEIKKTEIELGRAYKALGMLAFQIETGELSRDDDVFAAAVSQISDALAKIEGLKAGMDEIKTRVIVRKNAEASEAAAEEPAEEAAAEEKDFFECAAEKAADAFEEVKEAAEGCLMMKFCPICQIGNEPDAVKCSNCGYEF